MAESNLAKQLRIKSGSVKRIYKEYISYQQEEVKQKEKIAQMESISQCEHDINKQKEVLAQTVQMFPNVQTRLIDAVTDLEAFLTENGDHILIKDTEEHVNSLTNLQTAKEFIAALAGESVAN